MTIAVEFRKIPALARECARSESSARELIERAVWVLENDEAVQTACDAIREAAEQISAERDEC